MNKKIVFFLIVTLFAFSFSIYQYTKQFQFDLANAYMQSKPIAGHTWSEMQCTEGLCVTTDNKVGIGTDAPSKKLEVSGDILASGTGDVCNGAGACLSQISSFIAAQPIAGGTTHNRDNCTSKGGTLIYETGLANPICRFDAASCPSGWNAYENWSTTTPTAIASGASITCNGFTCSCPATGTSGSHFFSNTAVEARAVWAYIYWNTTCVCSGATTSTSSQACYINQAEGMYRGGQVGGFAYAAVTQIGCY